MRASVNKITPFQFFTTLFLCRVFSAVTYVASLQNNLSESDSVIMTIVMGVFLIITSIPTAVIIKKDGGTGLIIRAKCIGTPFAKVLGVIYILDLLFYSVVDASRFELLASSVMFPESNVSVLVVIVIILCAISAYRGIEAIGRSGVIFLVLVGLSMIFVFATLTDDIDMLNFTPIFESGVKNIVSTALYGCSRTGEIITVALMIPYITDVKSKHLFTWIALVSLMVTVIAFFISGVLGSFGQTQMFGLYSLSVLAEFGFIQRLDALYSCIWMICAAVKLTYFFYVCCQLMSELFGKKKPILYYSIISVVVFIGMLLVSTSIEYFAAIVTSPVFIIVYMLSVVVIPIVVLIGEQSKRRKIKHA